MIHTSLKQDATVHCWQNTLWLEKYPIYENLYPIRSRQSFWILDIVYEIFILKYGSASDSRARSLWFDTRSGHTLSFLLPVIQEEQLSFTEESMCTKYWLTA